jgi:hypothetical protein
MLQADSATPTAAKLFVSALCPTGGTRSPARTRRDALQHRFGMGEFACLPCRD